jgi:hypothetical protein
MSVTPLSVGVSSHTFFAAIYALNPPNAPSQKMNHLVSKSEPFGVLKKSCGHCRGQKPFKITSLVLEARASCSGLATRIRERAPKPRRRVFARYSGAMLPAMLPTLPPADCPPARYRPARYAAAIRAARYPDRTLSGPHAIRTPRYPGRTLSGPHAIRGHAVPPLCRPLALPIGRGRRQLGRNAKTVPAVSLPNRMSPKHAIQT